jgi:hypothetical protein
MKYENIKNHKEEAFKQVTGVSPGTFDAMLEVIKAAYEETHKKHNGRHRKLSREDMLLMTLEYYKEYRTLECLGASYGIRKPNVSKTIRWVEEALISRACSVCQASASSLLPIPKSKWRLLTLLRFRYSGQYALKTGRIIIPVKKEAYCEIANHHR